MVVLAGCFGGAATDSDARPDGIADAGNPPSDARGGVPDAALPAPEAVAGGPGGSIGEWFVLSGAVYWYREDLQTIFKKTGTTGETQYIGPVDSFFPAGSEILVVTPTGDVLRTFASGDPPQLLASVPISNALGIRPHQGRVFWAVLPEPSTGFARLYSASLDGGDLVDVVHDMPGNLMAGADDTYLYVFGADFDGRLGLHRVPKTGGTFEPPLAGLGPVAGFTRNDTHLFYLRLTGSSVVVERTDIDGTNPTVLAEGTTYGPGLAIGGDHLYMGGVPIRQLLTTPSVPEPITTGAHRWGITDLVVDETHVYWRERGNPPPQEEGDPPASPDTIWSIPRP